MATGLSDIADLPIEEITEKFISVPWVVGASLATGLIGGGVGYLFAKKKLEREYDEFARESIREVREHYEAKLVVAEPKPALADLVQELGYASKPEEPATPGKVAYNKPVVVNSETTNIFVQAQPDDEDVWDYKVEIDKRDPAQPYIIHKDEFDEREEHETSTYTYFAGDAVLCDERDAPIDNIDMLVGLDNLERFGHGSNDVNVVYIRNEPLEMDFEIVRSEGFFAQEVHGFSPDELQHSAIRRRPRRGFDDD